MNPFASLAALAALSPPIEDVERDTAMCNDIYAALGTSHHRKYWPWVLHHHFGWTARDVAYWRSDFEARCCACDEDDPYYLCSACWDLYEQFEAEEGEQQRLIAEIKEARPSDSDFERTTNADLVYLYFHFLHFEPEYRAQVIRQTEQVRALCGAEFFNGILWHLGWSHTEFAEAVLGEPSRHA